MSTAEAIFIIGLAGIALWQKHIFLYIASFIGLLLLGLSYAETSWALGIPVCLLAGYMLFRSIMYWFTR